MVTTITEDPPSPAPAPPPDTLPVRSPVPTLATWGDLHDVLPEIAVEVEHMWMTALRWRRLPAEIRDGWRTKQIFGFVVAHRVKV